MRASFLALFLSCLLLLTGCGAALTGQIGTETPTGTPTVTAAASATAAATPTPAPTRSWQKLWTLPALPPPPAGTYGDDPPYLPQIAWSPANEQRLYLCRASSDYSGLPAVLHDLYRSDDQGQHWKAYALPEAAASCYLEVDPTNADVLVLQDDLQHSYVSRDGGQHWQAIPNPPQWDSSLGEPPNVQIMAGKLYVEGYWTTDLTHWTRWYPVADEQQPVYVQIDPQHPQTLYTAVKPNEFLCAGTPAALQKLSLDPLNYLGLLCRSDDGGQTWQFLAVVVGFNYSAATNYHLNEPVFCLALNQPETLYAWGYTAQTYPNPYSGEVTGDVMRSTDGGNTWQNLSGVFVGGAINTVNFLSCGAYAYAGQSAVRIDSDDAVGESNEWQNFALTANGDVYHVVDKAGTRQGVTMSAGVSLLKGTTWSLIAPYPVGLTTPDTSYELHMLLIALPSGASLLLAFTQQALYAYPLAAS